jgi:hypothetical protein
MFGHKAKLHHAKRHSEKIQMKKQLKAHDERNVKQKDDGAVQEGALPTYLLDREGQKVGEAAMTRADGRMQKHYPPRSRIGERIELPSMLYLYQRSEVSQKKVSSLCYFKIDLS